MLQRVSCAANRFGQSDESTAGVVNSATTETVDAEKEIIARAVIKEVQITKVMVSATTFRPSWLSSALANLAINVASKDMDGVCFAPRRSFDKYYL